MGALLVALALVGCGDSDQEQADRIADEVVKELQEPPEGAVLCDDVKSGAEPLPASGECYEP
jgi:hypothetical protein